MTDTKTFTLAEVARENKIDPKAARRKLRANAARGKDAFKMPKSVKSTKANTKWIWTDTVANRKAVTEFLTQA